MLIDEFRERNRAHDLGEDKEIKVKIPLDYHIKLHTVKVVKGQNISDTVKIALDNYFRTLRDEQMAHEAAREATPFTAPQPTTPFVTLRQ